MRRFRLTSRGIGFLIAAGICVVLAALWSLPSLLYATGLLAGMVMVAGIFVAAGPGRITVERTFSPAVVEPGHAIRAQVTVSNLSGRPCPEARWSDQLPGVVAGRAGGLLPALGPFGGADARIASTYGLSSSVRGHHDIGPLRIEMADPFGLIRRERICGGRHRLTVLPARFALPQLASLAGDDMGASRPAPRHVGLGEEDVIARPYVPGDEMKRLHWKATAHRGELMVRQEEHQVSPRATVLLDLDAMAHGTEQNRGRWEYSTSLEWAISAAASTVCHLADLGYVVTLLSHDHAVDVVVGDAAASAREALIELAGCTPSTTADAPMPADRSLIVVGGRLTVDRAEAWIARLPIESRVYAMVAATTPVAVRDRLDAAGWHTAIYTPHADIPGVWAGLDDGRWSHAVG